jgi:hypothetical protein
MSEIPENTPPGDGAGDGYQFPPGTPPEVPADFEAARTKALASQLSPEEIAEFRALRAEKKQRDQEAAEEAERAAARLSPPTHRLVLGDGTTVDGSTVETHYAAEDGALVPVASASPHREFVTLF